MAFEPNLVELSSASIQYSTNDDTSTLNPPIVKENIYLDELCVNELNFIKADALLRDTHATFNCTTQSPYDEVNASVPIINDDKMPYLTFRTVFMCLLLTIVVSVLRITQPDSVQMPFISDIHLILILSFFN
ncbi:unnamed protein product [Didymodactylos carnosus]|uniref:Uncharacterized protein n=1 Tax=Didymodactylos carnosus TaxID=1234261 RepID=A0A815NH86_9BILA|nr:unnamed protein product [Didymodactylos carnosus]